jgi:pilus assembly protein Flp/PilA
LPALLADLVKDKTGVTAIEYAMIGVLIAIVIVGVVTGLGTNLNSMFSTISTSV